MEKKDNKTKLSKEMGVARSSLYYKPKREMIDLDIRKKIKEVIKEHKSYGHKRIALELKLNKKRILRVMKKYGIKPYRRRCKKPVKKDDLNKPEVKYPNLIKNREIVGLNISFCHNNQLVIGALRHAIKRIGKTPVIIHSDQGSEYDSDDFIRLVTLYGIKISMSKKQSPWENPFQESFYSQFKVNLGFVSGYDTIEELIEGIYQTIHYYNHERIHTSLKMSPVNYKKQFENRLHNTV